MGRFVGIKQLDTINLNNFTKALENWKSRNSKKNFRIRNLELTSDGIKYHAILTLGAFLIHYVGLAQGPLNKLDFWSWTAKNDIFEDIPLVINLNSEIGKVYITYNRGLNESYLLTLNAGYELWDELYETFFINLEHCAKNNQVYIVDAVPSVVEDWLDSSSQW